MKQPADPTPEEIAALTAIERSKWDENTERRRAGRQGRHYEVPEVHAAIKIQDTEGE